MAARLLSYRVFSDDADKMNLSVSDVGGGLLLISQFTLAADTNTGKRASFSSAAPPGEAEALFNRVVDQIRQQHAPVATGKFGADMQVSLVNDGPVTFLVDRVNSPIHARGTPMAQGSVNPSQVNTGPVKKAILDTLTLFLPGYPVCVGIWDW